MSPVAPAHEWDGDKWAKDQIQLTSEMMNCAELIKNEPDLFQKECDGPNLKLEERLDQRFGKLQARIQQAVIDHSGQADVPAFKGEDIVVPIADLIVDFKDQTIAVEAIESMQKASIALEYIIFTIKARAEHERAKRVIQYSL